jgi:primosomal protein N' (replication factor Y)
MYVQIWLPTLILKALTYQTSELLSEGQIVIAPLRNRSYGGICVGESTTEKPPYEAKSLIQTLPICLPPTSLSFLEQFSRYNLFSKGRALKMMVPFLAEDLRKMEFRVDTAVTEDFPMRILLNDHQEQAAQQLLSRTSFAVDWIDGVTGSGKTEVYLAVLAQRLKETEKKQALILLPEIALTEASIQRFQHYFQRKPWIWHSGTSKVQKRKIWEQAITGQPLVVIGARSALFLPFSKLATLIVDEEHDASYKQNEQGAYQARDMAILRGKIEDIPVILASATPSLETFYNVKTHKYGCVQLKERFSSAALPHILSVDMRLEKDAILSDPLVAEMKQALKRKEQILLFINQRGYAPLSICRKCGFQWQCPSCSVHLIEHRNPSHFLCHHCGYQQDVSYLCPQCQAEKSRRVLGIGMDRVLERVRSVFPEARCATFSSDTLTSSRRWEAALQSIYANEIDILLGTQILAKGHHFPNLTVVGIIEADRGASGCDLRAHEKTFQVLHQVAGRAGRGQKPGRVFLQTYHPEAPLMQILCNKDRDRFYEYELEERQDHQMPPFQMLLALILSGRQEQDVLHEARRLAQSFPCSDQALLWGPVPAPLAKLQGRFRYRMLIKGNRGFSLQQALQSWAKSENSSVTLTIDVDPYDFL